MAGRAGIGDAAAIGVADGAAGPAGVDGAAGYPSGTALDTAMPAITAKASTAPTAPGQRRGEETAEDRAARLDASASENWPVGWIAAAHRSR